MSRRSEKSTLYDVLGLRPEATRDDIERSYRRLAHEMKTEAAAPDPRRAALVHQAHEVLTDARKRAAYDRSLKGGRFLGVPAGPGPGKKWGVIAAITAGALGGLWWLLLGRQATPPKAVPGLSQQEIQTAALVAVGRVSRIEMSGARTRLSVAVAIEEGVMMAPCEGIGPGAQLVVRIPPRDIPAQLRRADEATGLCRLAVSGGASWPLATTGLVPRHGDRIYVASFNPAGDVVVVPGDVLKIVGTPAGNVIEPTARAGPPPEGTPLLDTHGRVVAVALKGEYRTLPSAWIADVPVARRGPAPAGEAPAPAQAAWGAAPSQGSDEAADAARAKRLEKVSPEKREALEKAFRPPTKVP